MKIFTQEAFAEKIKKCIRRDKIILVPSDTFLLIVQPKPSDLLVYLKASERPGKIIRSDGFFAGTEGIEDIVAFRNSGEFQLGFCLRQNNKVSPLVIGLQPSEGEICTCVLIVRFDDEPSVSFFSILEDTATSGTNSYLRSYDYDDSLRLFNHTLRLLLALYGVKMEEINQAFLPSPETLQIER